MLSSQIASLARRQSAFPSTGSAGYYEFVSRTITVFTADRSRLEHWSQSEHYLSHARDYLTTAIHEITHWLDHSSTLWGRAQIVAANDAIAAWESDQPDQFWRVRRFARDLESGASLDFFNVVDQPGASGKAYQWKYEPTVGLRFDCDGHLDNSRPIPLVSFHDLNGSRIARVPLTTLALLEANAVWAEIVTHAQITASLPEDQRVVEAAHAEKRAHDQLYNPNLMLYSAGAHLIAGAQQTSNAAVAYKLTSALSTAVLNLPQVYFDSLTVPDRWRKLLAARADALIANRDRGFAFLILSDSAPRFETGLSVRDWLEVSLTTAGLPSRVEWEADFNEELAAPAVMPCTQSVRTTKALELGRANAIQRGLSPESPLSLESGKLESGLVLPPLTLADDHVVPFGESVAESAVDVADAVSHAERFHAWAQSFNAACRA